MDAMLTAGGIPKPDDPLYALTRGRSKALLDIAGKPMGQWILDALGASAHIDSVLVVGLDESSGLTCSKPLRFIPNQGGMINNIIGAARSISEFNPKARHVLITSSDIPTITPDVVDWVVGQVKPEDDIVYNVVERSVMEARFPNSQRTFTKLKGIEICGGDMNAASIPTILAENSIWEKMADARKSPVRQAALVGFDTLLLLLLRAVDVEGAARRISKKLDLRGRGVLCPYPEVAMDVDKPHHLDVVRRALEGSAA